MIAPGDDRLCQGCLLELLSMGDIWEMRFLGVQGVLAMCHGDPGWSEDRASVERLLHCIPLVSEGRGCRIHGCCFGLCA